MSQKAHEESRATIIVAIIANLVIAVAKFFAAFKTGSSAMISEGIHSVVDTCDGLLLLLGQKRSALGRDEIHSFGHGKELYFWSFVVAILIFALGGGMSIYEGVIHLLKPHPVENPNWNYFVLGIALISEGTSFFVAYRAFKSHRKGRSILKTIHLAKDPSLFTIILEDSAAISGIVVAAVAVYLSHALDNPYIDGSASIIIGLILTSVAFILARECKGLLIGEAVTPAVKNLVCANLTDNPYVESVHDLRTMHLGPHEILLVAKIVFKPEFQNKNTSLMIKNIKKRIKKAIPDVKLIYVEPYLS